MKLTYKSKIKVPSPRRMKLIGLEDLFFYIGMLLQLYYTGRIITINSYENSSVYVLLILLCFSIAIIKSKFTKKEINILAILIVISLLHMIAVNDTNLLRLCMMCYAGRRVNSDALKKFFFMAYVGLFVVVYYLSSNGMIDSGMFQEGVWRVTKGWETRVTLGFDGATRMMFIWICIIASCQLLFGAKMLVRDAIFLYISIYLFKISVSYTGIIVSVAAIATPYIFTFCVKMFGEDCVKLILRGSLITVLVLTLVATVIDLSNTALGIFLNGRTGGLHSLIANGYYPSLFGVTIPENARGLDNSYFYSMYVLGLIPLGLMIVIIWQLSGTLSENRDLAACSVLVSFILIAYVTQTLEQPYLNYFLFLLMENWEDFVIGVRNSPMRRKFIEERKA